MRHHPWIISLAYAWLVTIGVVAWILVDFPVASAAVLGLLVLAYCCRRSIAIATAIVTTPIYFVGSYRAHGLRLPLWIEDLLATAIILGCVLLADALRRRDLLIQERLRRAEQNAALDELTQMPNRRAFLERLQQAIAAERIGKVAILFADLDGFKDINDLYGHDVGDKVLIAASSRLAHRLRESDFVARIGGDEFGFIIPGVRDRHDLDHIVQDIQHAFDAPFAIQIEQQIHLGVSVGICLYPDEGSTAERLLTLADDRMYQIKRKRKSSIASIQAT